MEGKELKENMDVLYMVIEVPKDITVSQDLQVITVCLVCPEYQDKKVHLEYMEDLVQRYNRFLSNATH